MRLLSCGECRKATQPLQGEVFSSLEAACAEQKERSGFELIARRSSGKESRAAAREELAHRMAFGCFLLCGECRKATQPLQGEVFSSLETA